MPLYHLLKDPFEEAEETDRGQLDNTPEDYQADERRIFDYAHAQDHLEIQQAIFNLLGINLPVYDLYPVDEGDLSAWLERHQAAHNDFNALFNLNNVDLQNVNLKKRRDQHTWTYLNYAEHQAVRALLRI